MASIGVIGYKLRENKLVMKVKGHISKKEKFRVILQDRSSKTDFIFHPEIQTIENDTEIVKLDLSNVSFHEGKRNIFDLFFLVENKRYRVESQSIQLQRKSSRYSTSQYKINNTKVAVPYLTVNNNLSILYGNASVVFKDFCREITLEKPVNAVIKNQGQFSLVEFDTFEFIDDTFFLAFYDHENTRYLSLNYILDTHNMNKIYLDSEQPDKFKAGVHSLVVLQKKRNILAIIQVKMETESFDQNTAFNKYVPAPSVGKEIIKSHITLENVKHDDEKISFEIDKLEINNPNSFRVFFRDRSNRKWFPEVNHENGNGTIVFEVDISEFIQRYAEEVSRWDLYLESDHTDFLEENRLGNYELPPLATHERYYNSIRSAAYNVVTPYLTVKNGLSIVIKPLINLYNEMLHSNTEIIDFKKGNGRDFIGEVFLELEECENYKVESALIKYRNKMDDIQYSFNVNELKKSKTKSVINFKIDTTGLRFEQYYWDIFLQVKIDDKKYLIRIKNPTKELSESISTKEKEYRFKLSGGFILYPYITMNNAIALTYRQKEKYEGVWQQIRERLAYTVYKMFKTHFDKKQIWLVYEKFSQTAQDNSYYFFKYAYENHPNENIYYIIDKQSPDYANLKGMEDRVISFMSFRHLLYLYASRLFVSSEARGHCYILRQQNGRMRNEINNKKAVFLQHGVTALKKVGSTYSKSSKNAVDLFVVSSDREREIIVENFGYNKEEVEPVGLCRWDALEDKSADNPEKEILLMPTWRSWLDDVSDKRFMESDYYDSYIALLNSSKLQKTLQDNNIIMNFYIHPKFKAYIDKFKTDNKNIRIYQFGEEKVNELLMRSSLLITDYSSVSWDQYYQKKPVIFYQFDYQDYDQLQGSYINMETNLFGDRVFCAEQLIDLVGEYIDSGFVEKEKYMKMREQYFKYVDQNNCERNYMAIKNNKEKLDLK
jgi:CDP-glycerol glycerophosphotransferase (TagB/SpsB family)